jgi:tripartite-type tricarboxylate transporter receptor subunit TctC
MKFNHCNCAETKHSGTHEGQTKMKIKELLFAMAGAMVIGSAVIAQTDPPTYQGETIELVLPAAAGGSYGLYGQLVADHLGRHIEGAPVIVPTYIDGAGGRRASNYVANIAARDGNVLYMIHQNAATSQLLDPEAAQYDVAAMKPIGLISAMNSVMVMRHDTGIATIADVPGKEIVVGSTGRGSYQYIVPTLLNQFIGAKFNVVSTYAGTGETMLALERGEIGAFMTSLTSLDERQPTWKDGTGIAQIVLQVGESPAPGLEDVPLLTDLAGSDAERAIYRFMSLPNDMARALVMPDGTPDARVAIMRDAFLKMVADPLFQSEAQRMGLPLQWSDSDTLSNIIAATLATPAEVVDLARRYQE